MDIIDVTPMILLGVILIIAVITDIRFHKIPNWITFPAMMLGIAHYSYMNGSQGLIFSISGLFLGIAIFMPFYFLTGMGAGDVKLLGAVGCFLGAKGVLVAFLATALIGGVYAIILLAAHGYFKETARRYWTMLKVLIITMRISYIPPENKEKLPVMAYGVAIASGTFISVLMVNVLKVEII